MKVIMSTKLMSDWTLTGGRSEVENKVEAPRLLALCPIIFDNNKPILKYADSEAALKVNTHTEVSGNLNLCACSRIGNGWHESSRVCCECRCRCYWLRPMY